MVHQKRSIAAVVGGLLLLGNSGALAQDWPQWAGPARDGRAPGFSAPSSWPKELTQKWKVNVGTGDATPALVGDRLYVFARQGNEEVLLCLDAADGSEQWRHHYPAETVGGPARGHGGPRATPAVAEGRVVTLGVSGVLCCVDAREGKEVWRKDEIKQVPRFYTSMSPLVVDQVCIAHLGGRNQGAVIACDLKSGEEKWKWTGDGPSYASPMMMTVDGTKQIVVQAENNLVGLAAADGKLLWQLPTPIEGRSYNAASPVIHENTVFYTGQGSGVYAVAIEKQADGFKPRQLWHNDQMGTLYNTPVLKDGLLFGISSAGRFFCLDAKDGRIAWSDAVRRDGFGTLVDAGPVLLSLPGNAELIAFKPDGREYVEVAKYQVSAGPIYTYPVVAGKRVFVKDRDSLTMFTLE